MTSPDASLSTLITNLAGEIPLADKVMNVLACDFFMPMCMSLSLLFLWFGTRNPIMRVKNQYGAMCASASLGFGNLGVHVLNRVTEFDPWPRPFEVDASARQAAEIVFYLPSDPSFPANVAALTFGAATGMWFYNRRASIPLFIIAVVWSFSRVYAGVHYPLDVLGGAVIGIVMGGFSYILMRILWPLPAICFWIARKVYVA